MKRSSCGDLVLLHHLQQGGLHFRGRAVDLIGQQQIGEHRAELGDEAVARAGVHARADQVGGHQIGGELNAAERATHDPSQGFDRRGLGQAWHTLEQDVPTREQRHQQALE
jgi:hypothetical protein